jgi:hypothetical protein
MYYRTWSALWQGDAPFRLDKPLPRSVNLFPEHICLEVRRVASKPAITPQLFDPLPGQFAIRTRNGGSFVRARLFGGTEVDALITPSQQFDSTGRFTFEGYLIAPTHIKTAGGYYVIAFGGGGIGGVPPNDNLAFNTFYTVFPADNWGFFEIHGPDSTGLFTITTLTGNYVTAVDGGGQSTSAFHTDAVKASTWEQFYITKVGDLGQEYYYAIRPVFDVYEGDSAVYGRYLSATSGGGLVVGNAIQVVYGISATTKFKLVLLGNGTYAIQTSNGVNYVTADQGGGLAHGSSTDGNLQTNRSIAQSWEEFVFTDLFDGTFSIKTSSGFLLGYDLAGNISTRIGSVEAAPTIGYTARFELVMVNPG